MKPADLDRRAVLLLTAAGALGCGSATGAPPRPPVVPGKRGEFDFLTGEWRIHHRQAKVPGSWIEFEGEATCWSLLEGLGSIEELRIPSRGFSGVGIRLLDQERSVWTDFWVSGKSGVLTTPGMTGAFVDGVGTFLAEEMDGDTKILVRGVWDRITPTSHRWFQGVSRDGGVTWEDNWFMDWTRVSAR